METPEATTAALQREWTYVREQATRILESTQEVAISGPKAAKTYIELLDHSLTECTGFMDRSFPSISDQTAFCLKKWRHRRKS